MLKYIIIFFYLHPWTEKIVLCLQKNTFKQFFDWFVKLKGDLISLLSALNDKRFFTIMSRTALHCCIFLFCFILHNLNSNSCFIPPLHVSCPPWPLNTLMLSLWMHYSEYEWNIITIIFFSKQCFVKMVKNGFILFTDRSILCQGKLKNYFLCHIFSSSD